MSCYYPVGTVTAAGEHKYRPCGSCIGCRLEYSRQWAVRCFHESTLYDLNCFLTLTYNNASLPIGGSLNLPDVQKFLKRLRKRNEPREIRYFGCGEYGEKLGRPHYHLCLFNFSPKNSRILRHQRFKKWRNHFRKSGYDCDLYTSKEIEELWGKGFITFGEVNMQSAAYCARYVTKKVSGEHKKKWYDGKEPEFAMMSRRGGIGGKWIEQNFNEVYPKDYVVIDGVKHGSCRFYDDRYKKKYPKGYEEVKRKREKWSKRYGRNPSKDGLRGMHLEKHRLSITKTLERKLENA